MVIGIGGPFFSSLILLLTPFPRTLFNPFNGWFPPIYSFKGNFLSGLPFLGLVP